MPEMRFHPEVLEARQTFVLDATAPRLAARGFRLGGGTGLLAYFEDAEKERMPEMLWDLEWPEVRRQIEAWVAGLARA